MQSDINLTELLAWYADAGIDAALLDEPVNRFEEAITQQQQDAARKKARTGAKAASRQPSRSPGTFAGPTAGPSARAPSPNSAFAGQEPAIPDNNAISLATEVAEKASSLRELHEAIESFQSCNLKFTARSTLFAIGNAKSDIMLIGGTPGREEDARGDPFTGPQGRLLDRMLNAIGLDRQHVYLANCAPWRPPGGRSMSPVEMEICRPFIVRHVALADPDILILMGGACSKLLLKNKREITGLRGKWTEFPSTGRAIPALPMLSLEYLLKNPGQKNLAWQDLLSLKGRLNEMPKKYFS